jgi:hypothetical protein
MSLMTIVLLLEFTVQIRREGLGLLELGTRMKLAVPNPGRYP